MKKPCARLNCSRKAQKQPELHLRDEQGGEVAVASVPLPTCDQCIPKVAAQDFTGQEGWAELVQVLSAAGKRLPERELTVLVWVELS